jgi:eukaryotic-like serine/threonine-protein kinase
MLFIGTFRSDEVDNSAFLGMWDELQRKHEVTIPRHDISVAPLSEDECTELVVAHLGQKCDVIRRRAAEFAQATGGNPFRLIELLGCFDPDTDSFEPLEMHEVLDRKL